MGLLKTDFQLKVSQEVCNSLPANVISFNKILSYARLSRNTKRQKSTGSLSSKLELKRLVKPETASSTPSTLHRSRLNISFQSIEEMFQYIEL